MKRANGTGSVYKLSGRRRKSWAARKSWLSEDGIQEYKSLGTFRTKAEAEKAIAIDDIIPISEKSKLTLAELCKEWMATRAFTRLNHKTQSNYTAAYRYMSMYANVPFANLRAGHFQSVIDRAESMGRGGSTLKKIKVLQTILCKYAMSQDVVLKNYAQSVIVPAEKKSSAADKAFSELDMAKIEQHGGMRDMDILIIMLYTGFRISEVFNLVKFNVDLGSMLITGGLKTEAGCDRIVPIHPKIRPYIEARYHASSNYLFERAGVRLTADFFRKKIYPGLLRAADVAYKTPHCTRHTFLTLLSRKTDDTNSIKMLAGHTDYAFTANRYDHPDIERLRSAIFKL